MKYIGPDYEDNIILPGLQVAADPRNWTDAQIEEATLYNRQIFAYFGDGEAATIAVSSPPSSSPPSSSFVDKHHTYRQMTPSQLWRIVHNLNKFPSVMIVDSAKSSIIGEVQYLDSNSLIVSFSAAFSGEAYLN